MVTKCSFCHNFTGASNQKTSLTKVVKEYALMMEMLCKPLNMESFSHKILISSQQFLDYKWKKWKNVYQVGLLGISKC